MFAIESDGGQRIITVGRPDLRDVLVTVIDASSGSEVLSVAMPRKTQIVDVALAGSQLLVAGRYVGAVKLGTVQLPASPPAGASFVWALDLPDDSDGR